eukprot:2276706-Prymnesium_polylepis.2
MSRSAPALARCFGVGVRFGSGRASVGRLAGASRLEKVICGRASPSAVSLSAWSVDKNLVRGPPVFGFSSGSVQP